MQICLAWSVHRVMTLSAIREEKRHLGLCGEILCLDPDGNVIDPNALRGETLPDAPDEAMRLRSLTSLRRFLSKYTNGRVFIGGKRAGFEGAMPGLIEEALYAFELGQPVYLAGGFGGITREIAQALGVVGPICQSWLESQEDDRLAPSIARLIEVAKQSGYESLKNGLSKEENAQLAACHRPSEIAALVSLGLGRRFAKAK